MANKRIVGVKFQSKFNPDEFYGREYNYYEAPGLNLKVGDIVVAPVGNGEGLVKVTSVDVPESKVDERLLPILKTITKDPEDRTDKAHFIQDDPFENFFSSARS